MKINHVWYQPVGSWRPHWSHSCRGRSSGQAAINQELQLPWCPLTERWLQQRWAGGTRLVSTALPARSRMETTAKITTKLPLRRLWMEGHNAHRLLSIKRWSFNGNFVLDNLILATQLCLLYLLFCVCKCVCVCVCVCVCLAVWLFIISCLG